MAASKAGGGDFWILIAAVFMLVSAGIGYWAAQRTQRQIDMIHLGLKQAAHGNYAARLPEEGARTFMPVFQEFNDMLEALDRANAVYSAFRRRAGHARSGFQ